MTVTVRFILILLIGVVAVSAAGILESLLSWEEREAEGRLAAPRAKCLCQTSGCLCCIDLNLTSTIDLGGPACINIKQKEQNVTLNLSYGDNTVHNATIMIDSAANKPTCMNLLSDLAQLCAKFTSITRANHGHDGCLVIQPALMKTPQATYNIGCFNFNQGIRQIEISTDSVTDNPPPSVEEDEDEEVGINTDELIAVVSASAEHGIALFSQWLGLNLNPKLNLTSNNRESSVRPSSRTDETMSNGTSRMGRVMTVKQSEKNDERFKRLLSAQDNILKESAKIGNADGGQTTFVYSGGEDIGARNPKDLNLSSIDDNNNNNINININNNNNSAQEPIAVPQAAQRGGRAYNIHMHINEV